MKEFEKIKHSWKEVSIKDYNEICKVMKRPQDSDLEKQIAVAAILCDRTEREMYDLDVASLKQVLTEIEWVNQPFKFDYRWQHKKMNINGKKCKVFQTIEELSVAQYMDFQTYWEDRDNNIGGVLACFIVPEGKKYNEDYDVRDFAEELERTLSIEDWNAIAFFLLRNWLVSIRASIYYSAWMIQKMIWKEKDKERKRELRAVRKELLAKLRSIRCSL